MDKPKWYRKFLIVLLIVIFSPLIIVGIVIGGIYTAFRMPKMKREYKNSRYYADFGRKFTADILYSPEYRFYNGAVSRNLPIKYIRQETNGFEYFIYDDTLYLFPDFDGIDYIEDKSEWMVDYDGDSDFFDRRLDSMLSKLENRFDYPIRVLAERRMFYRMNLSGMDIPESIFITQSYDDAFENDASPLKMIIPQSTEELYGMMLETPDLCGRFELDKSAGSITWNLSENIVIEIGVDPPECYIGINKSHGGKVGGEITHLHPSVFEIYDEICKIGRRGNVTVLRASPVGSALLYAGREDVCPYPREKKLLLGKYYYLEAR